MEPVEVLAEHPLECPQELKLDPDDLCDCNPEFAVICSFIQQFGEKIDLELDIEKLKSGIENQENLDDELIDIHVKLLKKLRRYFVRDQWEKALMRYAFEYSYEHGREIETQGYLKTRPSVKLQLLRRLLDAQFECDQKFKAVVNTDEAEKLRNQPLGRDIRGNIYWHCQDKEGHLRVYNEQPSDHRSWKLLCKDTNELDKLIEDLDQAKDDKIKGEPQVEPYNPYPDIFPEYFIKDDLEPEDNEGENDTTSKRTTKKGRRGRLAKKPSPPTSVQPPANESKPNKPIILQKDNGTNHLPAKLETRPLEESSQATSIESQVKQTLDNIIQKVSNSLDFFFRWNSATDQKREDVPKTKPRKRNAKRDKPPQEELPRRTSSRIQQMQQRKITEYVERRPEMRAAPEDTKVSRAPKEDIKSNNIHSHSKKSSKRDKQRWRAKGKKKLSWDKDDSDLSSTSSLTESNDESFVEELNGALDPETVHESDEFACEEEETNDAPVIIKRARTARQIVESQEDGTLSQDQSIVEEDKPCGRCDKSNDPECILLCDMCDDGYHTACCIPPLMFVPDGDWFCPPCEHKALLRRLKEISSTIKEILSEKERERQKRQRLRQAFKKTAVTYTKDEIVPEKRSRTQLPELNPPIAVQDLDDILGHSSENELPDSYRERAPKRSKKKKARQPRNKRRAKDISDDEYDDNQSRTYSRRQQLLSSEDEESISSKSSDEESRPRARKARACVSYRFQEYDELIQSAIQADSDDQMRIDDDSPEEKANNYGRGKDMATIEAIAYQQENGIKDQALTIETNPVLDTEPANKSRSRKKSRRLNDLDAESEIDAATSDDSFQAASETDVEEEEEDITEVDSEDESSMDEIINVRKFTSRARKKKKRNRYESDESDYEPRTRRRASQKVSYKESTDDDDEDILDRPHREKKGVLSSDEDTDASWKSSAKSQTDQPQEEEDAPGPVTSNPMEELDQYCNQGPYPGSIFSSFNVPHPPENPPLHPPFYREDEVRPPSNPTTNNIQRSW